MTRPVLERMCPFFIVSDVARSIAFYRDMLGFQTWHQEPDDEPFFAVIGRDGAQLFLKAGDAAPMPNPTRDPAMRWDAYVLAYDPDAIATEFADRGVTFSVPLMRLYADSRLRTLTDIPCFRLPKRRSGVEQKCRLI